MNTIKRITVICFAVLVLAANLPLCASATDPVSAATMANAMAQAITAYGASQGVSMTFDVANPVGIGEGVHELWDQFVEDVNDPNTPTYDSLAVTMWSNLYSKIGNNLGINISASEMPYIDAFWNWVLSGPAEMTKVDNQYYEWNIDANTGVVETITVNSIGTLDINGYTLIQTTNIIIDTYNYNGNVHETHRTYSFSQPVYAYQAVNQPSSTYICPVIVFDNTFTMTYTFEDVQSGSTDYRTYLYNDISKSNYGGNYKYSIISQYDYYGSGFTDPSGIISPIIYDLPYYYNLNDRHANPSAVFGPYSTSSVSSDDISVRPYIGDAVPQNVYIPDNNDVNYNPTDVAIPLDIPWDNTLFGDGSGVLTDAQSEAAAHAADSAITDSLEKTLTIADTENPSVPAPNEVYIPLLPVELPSFNFSLSGIWHYVVSWVQSLGAWLSLMFQTWAILPSAITIPVYATAVIVIVLGVYKRFFM